MRRQARLRPTPPVTIETYAWFIRTRRAAEPRRLRRGASATRPTPRSARRRPPRSAASDAPTYIGMTATDQLLQKHVGDVFPAEVADFPLADAVRRGVVAPLRARARAARRDPAQRADRRRRLRPARAGRGARPRGAQHGGRDALPRHASATRPASSTPPASTTPSASPRRCARRASRPPPCRGRTPPRELAATLAAYERGEINVLVNAQLLAEGWNAPRATVCMHLAPTASRRVYQQRIGRIMRLHRRKEAGVVVDFVEAAAPHSDRTVTLHTLLDVDVYQPGALVTPRSPRRRQRWRRPEAARPRGRLARAGHRRPGAAARDHRARTGRQIAIDRLPLDEQGMWAETAARRVAPEDLPRLAEKLLRSATRRGCCSSPPARPRTSIARCA